MTGDQAENMRRLRTILLMALWILSTGCEQRDGFRLSSDPLKARQQLLERIPVGTPLATAKERMERFGFKCELLQSEEFAAQTTRLGEQGQYIKYRDINYLCCTKERPVFPFGDRVWVVALVIGQGGLITNILIQVWTYNYI